MATLSVQREGMTISNVTQNPSRKAIDKTNLKHSLKIVHNVVLRNVGFRHTEKSPKEDSPNVGDALPTAPVLSH